MLFFPWKIKYSASIPLFNNWGNERILLNPKKITLWRITKLFKHDSFWYILALLSMFFFPIIYGSFFSFLSFKQSIDPPKSAQLKYTAVFFRNMNLLFEVQPLTVFFRRITRTRSQNQNLFHLLYPLSVNCSLNVLLCFQLYIMHVQAKQIF